MHDINVLGPGKHFSLWPSVFGRISSLGGCQITESLRLISRYVALRKSVQEKMKRPLEPPAHRAPSVHRFQILKLR
jgi:hypothetical protein